MTSDLVKLTSTFEELKIPFTIVESSHHDYRAPKHDKTVTVDAGCGYEGFAADFYFLDGRFVGHGCWE